MIHEAVIEELRLVDIQRQQQLIGGRWVDSVDFEELSVLSPIDGQELTTIPDSTAVDIDLAVSDSRRAFTDGGWPGTPPKERKRLLFAIADAIESHTDELAVLGVRDNGTEISMAYRAEAGSAAATFRYYAEALDKLHGEVSTSSMDILALVEREPIGVVGVIVPWNFPLMIAAWKIAPALAAGNCVVLKPAETASLALLRLGALATEAGLPPGVLNIVTGRGETAGSALALHSGVDAIAFTGSGVVGRRLLEYSARSNIKPVYLELGGKSPNIIFDDYADIEHAVDVSLNAIFRNAGQVCVSGSRLLVQRSIYREVLDKCVAAAERIRVGDPLSLNTQMGAINSKPQLEKNLAYVEVATSEGASLCTGGKPILEELGGYFMQPTVFANVDNAMRIAREEVFGPLLCVIPFQDEAEALQIANDSDYGLSAGVWTDNLSRAHRMIRGIQSGIVHVNCYGGSDLTIPLGGVKQSGNGYDKSLHALDKFSKLKSAWIQL